jgi:predicted HTH domain antitoxin
VAVERYRQGRASLGRAAEMAGVHVGDMIEILASYGIKSNLEQENNRQGLENLRKVW